MASEIQQNFIIEAKIMAAAANHPWPDYAACEAALESNFGQSGLAIKANNLFGMKAHAGTSANQILELPTQEVVDGKWIDTMASWMKYPTYEECFVDRLLTLQRLRWEYPNYDIALKSPTGPGFVINVSKTWSTDPLRAAKVLGIYKEFFQQ